MIMACFHNAGTSAFWIDRLQIFVRYEIPCGPRCFRCRIVRLSGPVAVEFLEVRMAFPIAMGLKGRISGSSL